MSMSMIGKQLAHYQVTGAIGKGGMGEVYRAQDTKLGRDVAVKVLPEEFARDADRVARFQREARLLASLNHPNIAAIHGLEEVDGTHFLVMELVEGQTLADRIKAGPIPVEESLKLALQAAEALEAAHEKGVIHRDLKPANIKVTPDGKVKVLDFGLAKAFAGEQASLNLSNSPTLSDAATQQGVILGTAAYMSPEQARGKPVDKRADIWAFGAVLYEMLTGRAAFSGRDVTDTLAAVIRSEPEWENLPANLHWRLRELLGRCLEKEAKDRYSGISDARVDIQKILVDPSGIFSQSAIVAESRAGKRIILPWIAGVILVGIVVGLVVWQWRTPEPRQVMHFDYELPSDQQFTDLQLPMFAVSPDGRQFVYCTSKGLYLRSLDETIAKPIAGTEGNPVQPFFSFDGKWIGYFSQNQLKKISINGGSPIVLCTLESAYGTTWNEDDTIVFGSIGGIGRISASGGKLEYIIKAENQAMVAPQVLPGGRSVLFTSLATTPSKVMVQSLKSGERKELFAGDTAKYLPTGHILYASGENLWAIGFDPGKLELIDGPIPVIDNIVHWVVPQYALSDSGTLLYVSAPAELTAIGRTLVWVDKNGVEESIAAPPKEYMYPKISPDGTRAALTINYENNWDIWIWDFVRKTLSRSTFDKAYDVAPMWTHDGKRILFASTREGYFFIYWKAADGTGKEEKLVSEPNKNLLPYSLSKDGKFLVIEIVEGVPQTSSKWDIGIIPMEGEHQWKPLLDEEFTEVQPQISPDGRWIVYTSSESRRNEIYVRPFPDVEKGKWQASTEGGSSARWSPDSRELYYLSNENSLMAIPIEGESTLKMGTPKNLFHSSYAGVSSSSGTPYDISPDGERFLMMKEPGSPSSSAGIPRKINIVVNWFEELKDRVAAN